jgi:hypothetical protein
VIGDPMRPLDSINGQWDPFAQDAAIVIGDPVRPAAPMKD